LAGTDSAANAVVAICRLNSALNRAFKNLGRAHPDTGTALVTALLVESADKTWHPFAAAKSVIYISRAVHARIISHYCQAAIWLDSHIFMEIYLCFF